MASSSSSKVLKLRFNDVRQLVKAVVPPLSGKSHKGQHGRIGVVGGSADYTGAPYYAAESALRFGGDLSFVFCAQQAAIPLKSYSPELMVTAFYDADTIENKSQEIRSIANKVTNSFDRLHGIVFGPGLGRLPSVANTALLMIIGDARAANLP
jgi:ATP-dependent NAD(P)H-hydrate dehydratase